MTESSYQALSAEQSEEMKSWAKNTFDLPPSITRKFLSETNTAEETFSGSECPRFFRARYLNDNDKEGNSESMEKQFCAQLQSMNYSAEEASSVWNSGLRKVHESSLRDAVIAILGKEMGLDSLGRENLKHIYEGHHTARLTNSTGETDQALLTKIRETNLFDGNCLATFSDDYEFNEARSWVIKSIEGAPGYSEALVDRVLGKTRTEVTSFLSTAKSLGDSRSTRASSIKWPEPIRLPKGKERTSVSSRRLFQPATQAGSSNGDRKTSGERADTRCNTDQQSPAGDRQMSAPTQLGTEPSTPPVPFPSVSGVSSNIARASTPPQDLYSPPASLVPSSIKALSSTSTSTSNVFSDACSANTAPSSTGTSLPDTVSRGVRTVPPPPPCPPLPQSSSSSLPSPLSTSARQNTTPAAPEISRSADPLSTLASPTITTEPAEQTPTDSSMDDKSKWRQSVLEELDRRYEAPQGLSQAMIGAPMSDEDLLYCDGLELRESALWAYRKEMLDMFPDAWSGEDSEISSLYEEISAACGHLRDDTNGAANRQAWNAKYGQNIRDRSFTTRVYTDSDYPEPKRDRVYDWLATNDQTEEDWAELTNASQRQDEVISSLETKSADPPEGGIEAIWAREVTELETNPTSCGIETNRPEALRDAKLGEEGDGNWENQAVGNWDYAEHCPVNGPGYPRRRQPEATGDRTFVDALEDLR